MIRFIPPIDHNWTEKPTCWWCDLPKITTTNEALLCPTCDCVRQR